MLKHTPIRQAYLDAVVNVTEDQLKHCKELLSTMYDEFGELDLDDTVSELRSDGVRIGKKIIVAIINRQVELGLLFEKDGCYHCDRKGFSS